MRSALGDDTIFLDDQQPHGADRKVNPMGHGTVVMPNPMGQGRNRKPKCIPDLALTSKRRLSQP